MCIELSKQKTFYTVVQFKVENFVDIKKMQSFMGDKDVFI